MIVVVINSSVRNGGVGRNGLNLSIFLGPPSWYPDIPALIDIKGVNRGAGVLAVRSRLPAAPKG